MKKNEILERYPPEMENLLPILHALQSSNPRNYLSAKDLARVAGYLNTSLSAIVGVASYYSMFSLRPRGKHIVRVCRSPVCHLSEEIDVFGELTKLLNVGVGATTPDRRFTLEAAECLGHCELAPVLMIDETVYGHLTPEKIRSIVRQYRGPQSKGRKVKAR